VRSERSVEQRRERARLSVKGAGKRRLHYGAEKEKSGKRINAET